MATRALIGILQEDGTVKSIYHHWDGYPEWLGTILQKHYSSQNDVLHLMEKGELISAQSEPETKRRPLRPPIPVQVAQKKENSSHVIYADVKNFVTGAIRRCAAYAYLFMDGAWHVTKLEE